MKSGNQGLSKARTDKTNVRPCLQYPPSSALFGSECMHMLARMSLGKSGSGAQMQVSQTEAKRSKPVWCLPAHATHCMRACVHVCGYSVEPGKTFVCYYLCGEAVHGLKCTFKHALVCAAGVHGTSQHQEVVRIYLAPLRVGYTPLGLNDFFTDMQGQAVSALLWLALSPLSHWHTT